MEVIAKGTEMRNPESSKCRVLAKEWANDRCPALAWFHATGEITPGLLAEVDYLIAIEAAHAMSGAISPYAAKREAQRLMTFRRLVQESSGKSPLSGTML